MNPFADTSKRRALCALLGGAAAWALACPPVQGGAVSRGGLPARQAAAVTVQAPVLDIPAGMPPLQAVSPDPEIAARAPELVLPAAQPVLPEMPAEALATEAAQPAIPPKAAPLRPDQDPEAADATPASGGLPFEAARAAGTAVEESLRSLEGGGEAGAPAAGARLGRIYGEGGGAPPYDPVPATAMTITVSPELLRPALLPSPLAAGFSDFFWDESARLGLGSLESFARTRGASVRFASFGSGDVARWVEPEAAAEFNWDVIGSGWDSLRGRAAPAGFRAGEAARVLALLLLPVVGHELMHGRVRFELGEDFPAAFEDELVAVAEAVRVYRVVAAAFPQLAELYFNPYSEQGKALRAFEDGFDYFEYYVGGKYPNVPWLSQGAGAGAERVAAALAAELAKPRPSPRRVGALERGLAFWRDRSRVQRVREHLRARIRALYPREKR